MVLEQTIDEEELSPEQLARVRKKQYEEMILVEVQ